MTKRNPRSTNLNSLKGMIVLGSMMATLYGARQLAEPAAPTPAPAAQPNYVLVIPEPPPAIASLAPFGRVVAVGLGDQPVSIYPYGEIINREAEIIGCSDHLASEIPLLTEFVRRGALDLKPVVTATIPLDPDAVNAVMDRMAGYSAGGVRTVIVN